jgi:hypothetical protein
MKHKVTVVLCVAALAGGGVLAVSNYNENQAEKQVAAVASQIAARHTAEVEATFNTGVRQLEAQCSKDKAAYAALAPALQLKTPAPVCVTNLVR